jgi:hypothetical protein
MKPVLVIPLVLAACTTASDPPVPSGEHHHFVVDRLVLPQNNEEARNAALDINGDGMLDNQLGMVFGTLAGQNFAIQGSVDRAIATGSILMLIDLQTPDLADSDGAGFELLLGASPSPAPCASAEDPVCGRHLDGTGTFAVAAAGPSTLAGTISDGTFVGGPGPITIQLALGGTATTPIELAGTRVRVESISEDGIADAVITGAITRQTVDERMLPVFQTALAEAFARDCSAPTQPPQCGCAIGSPGAAMMDLLDGSPRDCEVSVPELRGNSVVESITSPDVEIGDREMLSFGFRVSAVRASF